MTFHGVGMDPFRNYTIFVHLKARIDSKLLKLSIRYYSVTKKMKLFESHLRLQKVILMELS